MMKRRQWLRQALRWVAGAVAAIVAAPALARLPARNAPVPEAPWEEALSGKRHANGFTVTHTARRTEEGDKEWNLVEIYRDEATSEPRLPAFCLHWSRRLSSDEAVGASVTLCAGHGVSSLHIHLDPEPGETAKQLLSRMAAVLFMAGFYTDGAIVRTISEHPEDPIGVVEDWPFTVLADERGHGHPSRLAFGVAPSNEPVLRMHAMGEGSLYVDAPRNSAGIAG